MHFLKRCAPLGALLLAFGATKAHAATYVVDSTADTNLTACTASVGDCTLRGALNNSIANPDPDIIYFSIPGSGVKTIQLTSALPTLSGNGTLIDGYSQPGSSQNNLSTGTNAAIKIQIKGANNVGGLYITGTNYTVRGLSITGGTYGISMFGSNATGNRVSGNYIGVLANGTTAAANNYGVQINDASNNIIGGTNAGDRNLISGNTYSGVRFGHLLGNDNNIPPANNRIVGNIIGTNAAGTASLPNQDGVRVGSSSRINIIGGSNAGEGNVISGNKGAGVVLERGSTVQGNSIYNNGGLGIDLPGDDDGVTPNDEGDVDGKQNFPILGEAETNDGGITVVTGVLLSKPNAGFTIDFYSSPTSDPSFHGEGKTYLGSGSVSTDESGFGRFASTLPGVTIPPDAIVSATATDSNGNTSEFSSNLSSTTQPTPVISVNSPSVKEGNSGTTALTFTLSLSRASRGRVSVIVNTSQGTAKGGSDYQTVGRATVEFQPERSTQTFTVQVIGDTVAEADEQFRLDLRSPVGATIGTASGTGTIINDDLPSISINSPSVKEGNSGTTALTFTLTLSQASTSQVSVLVNTLQGTAKSGSDYQSVGRGTVTFAPGTIRQTFTVQVVGDTQVEGNEQFQLALRSPVNATLASTSGTGTIINDDSAPKSPSFGGSAPTS